MSTWDDRTGVEDILVRSIDDWVDFGDVVSVARRSGIRDTDTIRSLVLGLITEVLARGLMVAGDVTESGFRAWNVATGDAVIRISQELSAWDPSEITPGAICWFDSTPEGDRLGRGVIQRESD